VAVDDGVRVDLVVPELLGVLVTVVVLVGTVGVYELTPGVTVIVVVVSITKVVVVARPCRQMNPKKQSVIPCGNVHGRGVGTGMEVISVPQNCTSPGTMSRAAARGFMRSIGFSHPAAN
jgi:hypothetical protein